jgi:hypothetical protein
MDINEALDIVVSRTRHERYRWLCSDDNPDQWQREAYRHQIVAMASNEEPPQLAYPALAVQAANLFRSARDWAKSGFKLAPKAVRAERQATCDLCEKWDKVQRRCTACGCTDLKVYALVAKCPLDKWEK